MAVASGPVIGPARVRALTLSTPDLTASRVCTPVLKSAFCTDSLVRSNTAAAPINAPFHISLSSRLSIRVRLESPLPPPAISSKNWNDA